MKTSRIVSLLSLSILLSLVLLGCGKKADENKPISEVKAEAEEMNVAKLRSMALSYKDAVVAKKGEVEKLAGKLKEIPVTKILDDEAKELKSEIEALNKSVSALKERFTVYYDKLKEKGGNLTGLEL